MWLFRMAKSRWVRFGKDNTFWWTLFMVNYWRKFNILQFFWYLFITSQGKFEIRILVRSDSHLLFFHQLIHRIFKGNYIFLKLFPLYEVQLRSFKVLREFDKIEIFFSFWNKSAFFCDLHWTIFDKFFSKVKIIGVFSVEPETYGRKIDSFSLDDDSWGLIHGEKTPLISICTFVYAL